MSLINFEDQVAIVTGAGRNLGRGYAIDMARRGASVVVNDIDSDCADAVVAEIKAEGGIAVASYDTVASAQGGEAIVATAMEHFGTLDILINNAGNVHAGPFADMPLTHFEEVLAVHLKGAFCVTQPAWTIMHAKGYGRIIMSGSAGGVFPEKGYCEYATAKAGLVGLTRALAAEGKDFGILVNMINPQAGGSSMTANANAIPDLKDAKYSGPDVALAPYKSVAAISPVVQYLCSTECNQTGMVVAAGAGWYGRVFLGLTDGWAVPEPGIVPEPEDVAANIERIVRTREHIVPQGASEEMHHIATRLGLSVG